MIKVWWKRWQLQMRIKGCDTSREKWYNEDEVVLLTNWISKINIKKPYIKREKLKKGIKHQIAERYDKH